MGKLSKLIVTLLVLVGLINFLPLFGLFSVERISSTYGIEVSDNNFLILLKHRALLFGLIGGLVFFSVKFASLRVVALTMAGISMLGFILILLQTGAFNGSLGRIAIVDGAGLVLALIAALLLWIDRKGS
jgi:hypothetical protein